MNHEYFDQSYNTLQLVVIVQLLILKTRCMCCFYTIGLSRVYFTVFLILNTKQWTLNNAVCSFQCAVCNIETATSNSHCTQPSKLHFLNCTTHTAGPSRTKDPWQRVSCECVGTTVLAVNICKKCILDVFRGSYCKLIRDYVNSSISSCARRR